MSRIDRIGRADLLRKGRRPEADQPDAPVEAEIVRLPVPVERVSRIEPRHTKADGEAAFAAQLIGQRNQKRGLRAGPEVIDTARSLYNRTEWSGSKDRRAPAGGKAKTKI